MVAFASSLRPTQSPLLCIKYLQLQVDHLSELKPCDQSPVLPQGSHHQDRVFISSKREREIVTQLLTHYITVDEFLNSSVLHSENINLVKTLVADVAQRNGREIPAPYKNLICNVSKGSSARALLQCTRAGRDVLLHLRNFCLLQLEIVDISNQEILGEG